MIDFSSMDSLNTAFSTGAFVTSSDNVMVCSWGFVGVMWWKKIFIAPIRDSRFTKEFVEKTGEFTVSIPFLGEMKSQIAFCGTKSGRDHDKWAEAEIEKVRAKKVDSYVVGGCEKYIECKVIGKLDMKNFDISEINKAYPISEKYPKGDLHNFYFGEIVAEY